MLEEMAKISAPPPRRGRGRLSQAKKDEFDERALFKKEFHIKNQIQMVSVLFIFKFHTLYILFLISLNNLFIQLTHNK